MYYMSICVFFFCLSISFISFHLFIVLCTSRMLIRKAQATKVHFHCRSTLVFISFAFRICDSEDYSFCVYLSMCTSYSFHASRRGSLYLSCAVVRELVFSPLAFILRRGEVSRSRYSQRDLIQCVPRSLSLPGYLSYVTQRNSCLRCLLNLGNQATPSAPIYTGVPAVPRWHDISFLVFLLVQHLVCLAFFIRLRT